MHRGIGNIQSSSGLGQSEQTQCRDGRVPIVSIREDCMEPGLIPLLYEAVLEAVYLLYPIAAVLEYLTYHFCKARLLDLQDKIKLPTLPFSFGR